MTPTAMSRRTPPRPSATARSRFFFAGSSSASAARANAAASASTIESAEGQVPSSLRARSVTPQTAFPRLRCTAAALSEHARLPKAGRSSDRFHAQYPRIHGVLASVEATKRDGQDRRSRGAHVFWGSATNERRIGASPQRCQAQRCPFSAQTPENRKSAKSGQNPPSSGHFPCWQATSRHVGPPHA
jgi:hypothetical protein